MLFEGCRKVHFSAEISLRCCGCCGFLSFGGKGRSVSSNQRWSPSVTVTVIIGMAEKLDPSGAGIATLVL